MTILERTNTPSKITWKELKKGMKNLNEKVDYNEQENEIINGIHNKNIDISRIDLIIRWGGRRRLSGFLPVQSVYSDFFIKIINNFC